MKQYKRVQIFSAVSILAILLFSGCKKGFLDRDPQGKYTAETYPYPGGSGPYDSYLFAAYAELRAFNVHSQAFICATGIRSDDGDKGSTPSDGGAAAADMDNFPVQPNYSSNDFANALWVGYYALINKANIAIDQVQNNKDIEATEDVKMQSEAEAKFIRGYAYFMLVRLFGRVPVIDKVFTDPAAQSNVPQSSADQVYTLIESDLQFATQYLPPSWDPQKFPGRLTKGAANGLLAKVYLTRKKWAQAQAAANAVMTAGLYNLNTTYDKIFREEGENSSESVFEVQATANFTTKTALGVQYAQIMGVRGSGSWNLGWGWNTPSRSLDTAYEAGDPRRKRTILYTTGDSAVSIYGEVLPAGLPNPRYNNKVYSNPSMRGTVGDQFGYWMNVRILRYADVVLMFAEAANEVGGDANITAARDALNAVRARARAGNNAILPNVTTTDQATLRNAIRKERRIELAMEHDRFFDLVRWGIAAATLNAAGKTNFRDDRDVLLPIPKTQIDLSKGVLTQNPGYGN
ncbi:RagB/SusD family nutrient uptake outer membrane protein [Niabella sp.]|uniref:RagB/SusD family nutrient uptake outer membrane protein n=1 Tax=Niabella sp. TaxID=1962976 RepID=UPI002622F8E9|nr:RagB/SusD family nutrient uptake outer membrane protein [Niabella sp.]